MELLQVVLPQVGANRLHTSFGGRFYRVSVVPFHTLQDLRFALTQVDPYGGVLLVQAGVLPKELVVLHHGMQPEELRNDSVFQAILVNGLPESNEEVGFVVLVLTMHHGSTIPVGAGYVVVVGASGGTTKG
jgi:hypothetical protein